MSSHLVGEAYSRAETAALIWHQQIRVLGPIKGLVKGDCSRLVLLTRLVVHASFASPLVLSPFS